MSEKVLQPELRHGKKINYRIIKEIKTNKIWCLIYNSKEKQFKRFQDSTRDNKCAVPCIKREILESQTDLDRKVNSICSQMYSTDMGLKHQHSVFEMYPITQIISKYP